MLAQVPAHRLQALLSAMPDDGWISLTGAGSKHVTLVAEVGGPPIRIDAMDPMVRLVADRRTSHLGKRNGEWLVLCAKGDGKAYLRITNAGRRKLYALRENRAPASLTLAELLASAA